MKNTKPIFWWIVKSLVQVDRVRIGRVLEISFSINSLVLSVLGFIH
jgi:hypothetical protein